MEAKVKTEEILAGIELAVGEIIKPENLNTWISVRQRSITSILKECGVDYNYSSAFLEELRNVGLIETTSSGCGLRYMVRSLQIPDSAFLARKIYDNFKERTRKNKANDGYPSSPSGELRPMPKKRNLECGRNGAVKVIPAEIAHLGDIGYIFRDNEIKEVMVIGISYDTHDRKHVVYTVETYRTGENGDDYYNVIQDIPRGAILQDRS